MPQNTATHSARMCKVPSGEWDSGAWSVVFVGTVGAPAAHCGSQTLPQRPQYVTVDRRERALKRRLAPSRDFTSGIPSSTGEFLRAEGRIEGGRAGGQAEGAF